MQRLFATVAVTKARVLLERRLTVRTTLVPRGTPPAWYGWLSPATGCAALIVSLVSAAISWQAFTVNRSNRQDLITPKLAAVEVNLTHPRGKASDVPVVGYEVKNLGALTIIDVHSQLQYRYLNLNSSVESNKIPFVGSNNEGAEIGAKLVPADHIDRTHPVFIMMALGTKAGTFIQSTETPSYQKLRDGLATLSVQVQTQASDFSGVRIVGCDEFAYQWITDKFERRGACIAPDWTDSFRNPSRPVKLMTVDPRTLELVPDDR